MLFEGTRLVDTTHPYLWCSSLALSGLFCSQDLQRGVSLIPHDSNAQYRKDILVLASRISQTESHPVIPDGSNFFLMDGPSLRVAYLSSQVSVAAS
jgi:hypothetical protein